MTVGRNKNQKFSRDSDQKFVGNQKNHVWEKPQVWVRLVFSAKFPAQIHPNIPVITWRELDGPQTCWDLQINVLEEDSPLRTV